MAASATQNPASKSDVKSSKKKSKSKIESTEAPARIASPAPVAESTPAGSTNGDGAYESPYIKELYKSIRNVNKKITNASKVDNILAENPGKSLDELVASRKINADQKAQILKKPSLQASLAQLEEQIAQYKKFDQEYKTRLQTEKAEVEKALTDRSAKELEEAVAAAKAAASADSTKALTDGLLILTQFLKLAAIRRTEDEASMEFEENRAIEGILAKVYNGDETGVDFMMKLINGADEPTVSVQDETLSTTYASLKATSVAFYEATKQVIAAEPEAPAEPTLASDPTMVNAGLTEIDDPTIAAMTNGHEEPAAPAQDIPANASFGDGGNAAAEANWDNNNDLSTSQEWVEVPRDTAETDNGVTATPAAPSNVQSWADDQPESPAEAPQTAAASPNDGFHEVQRSRGGQSRGRGSRGGDRGRGGFRGDNRGRGRGGPRGGPRGGRPQES
ncbi:hypothetical protein BP6252_07998 [Coleophoma cylindrospora]|uniref:YAG7-like dimerisation domain-containing protein n=1 Tax=Coleophoma cylindrospora TaxID=1849047 RepID=A0A3D8RBP2_9HELO|nr:hypothetical protein BP6252_07998 [Coleophoma cylindrospora]